MSPKTTVSIIVTTYNERGNIEVLVPQIFQSCKGLNANVEVVIVDDNSPDGTGKLAERLGKKYNVKTIHRTGKQGLASAAILGFSHAKGSIIGVMDADLSHPPHILPKLIRPLTENKADIAVGSRYIKGGGVEVWPLHRRLMSRIATAMARPLTPVKDPLSGLFLMRRSCIEGLSLSSQGYKIGLEILVKGRYSGICEVPYLFRNRFVGKSKISASEYYYYIKNLACLYWHRLTHSSSHTHFTAEGKQK